jgi:hypothetical protein|nr:MAG TPA: hypothetical protein [Caudoviricetes sp.]
MTLLQYLLMPAERQRETTLLLEVVKPLPFFYRGFWRWKKKHGVERLTELKWGEVRAVIDLLSSGELTQVVEAFRLVYKIKHPARMNVYRFYACIKHLTNEVQRVLEQEQRALQGEPSHYETQLQQAGVEQLQPFKDLAIIDTLAQGDILRYEQVEALPYEVVFYTLYYRTVKQNIDNRFQQIITKK